MTKRTSIAFEIPKSKFIIEKMTYDHAYGDIYLDRLNTLYPYIKQQLESKFPDVPLIDKVTKLHQRKEKVALIGNLIKTSAKIPTLLNDYAQTKKIRMVDFDVETFVDEKDVASIEDDSTHLLLKMDHSLMDSFVSGTTLGFVGHLTDDCSSFEVEDVCYATGELKVYEGMEGDTSNYLALIDDFQYQPTAERLALFNCLCNNEKFSNVSHGVIIGKMYKDISLIKEFDDYLSNMLQTLPVTLIPTFNDPTNAVYPYQPFHPSLFPKSSAMSSYSTISNPGEVVINNKKVMFISDDYTKLMFKLTTVKTIEELFIQFIRIGDICPCTPNIFPSFPSDCDPFLIIKNMPDVFVFGGYEESCKSFDLDGKIITLVTVPSFEATKTMVLFDLDNLKINTVKFNL